MVTSGVPLVALILKVVLAAALFVHVPRSFDEGRVSATFWCRRTPG